MKKQTLFLFVLLLIVNSIFSQQSAKTPNYKLIIGTWQSKDDKNEVWLFSESYLKMKYSGTVNFDNKYGINDRCQNDQKTTVPETDKYITTSDNYCYYIIKLTADELELSYVGRGNTLRFIRLRSKINESKVITSLGQVKNNKVYFYSKPDKKFKKKSYLVKGDKIQISNTKGNNFFYFVTYMSENGRETSGYVLKKEIESS